MKKQIYAAILLSLSLSIGTYATTYASVAYGSNNQVNGTGINMVGDRNNVTGDGAAVMGNDNIVSSMNSVTIGNGASSLGGANVAIGLNSKAGDQEHPLVPEGANGATAVGTGAEATAYRAVAVGDLAKATNVDAIAMGTVAEAKGNKSLAIGFLAKANNSQSVALGSGAQTNANEAVSVGHDAHANGINSVAIGHSSVASSTSSMALGLNSKAEHANSVALGNDSVTGVSVSTSSMTVAGKTYDTAGSVAEGTISVGNDGKKRTVTNVAAGRVDKNSTDAVNGSQLHAVIQGVNENADEIKKGLNFAADAGTSYKAKLGDTISVKGDGKNISTRIEGATLTVSMSDTPSFKTVTANTVSGDTIKAGDTVTISSQGVDMGHTSLTNLKEGKVSPDSTDAVNGSQLYRTNASISQLSSRINRAGAGAAALAALHPLDFDPDDKWDFTGGYGNYRGANAIAFGAFYRPNEDTMFSLGTSFGGGENMINAGVTFKLGQGNHVSTSRVAMAKEIRELREELAQLKAAVAAGHPQSGIDLGGSVLFPDVKDNHWAYEYVRKLAGAGLLKGYPDGTFNGNRLMTRYEFAAVVYRMLEQGLGSTDDEMNVLVKEFAPELKYIRIDTIQKDRDGNPIIQRVRTTEYARTHR